MLQVSQAVAAEVGAARTGIRISPVTPANDISDSNPQALYDHIVDQLSALKLVYIHVVEGATGGPRDIAPFDYKALRNRFKGTYIANNGYTLDLANKVLAADDADLIAFGKLFISNPDLVERLKRGAPLNDFDKATFYGGDAKGLHGLSDAGGRPGGAVSGSKSRRERPGSFPAFLFRHTVQKHHASAVIFPAVTTSDFKSNDASAACSGASTTLDASSRRCDHVIGGLVHGLDPKQPIARITEDRKAAASDVAANDPLVISFRQPGDLQPTIALIAPGTTARVSWPRTACQRAGKTARLVDGILHRLQPQLSTTSWTLHQRAIADRMNSRIHGGEMRINMNAVGDSKSAVARQLRRQPLHRSPPAPGPHQSRRHRMFRHR